MNNFWNKRRVALIGHLVRKLRLWIFTALSDLFALKIWTNNTKRKAQLRQWSLEVKELSRSPAQCKCVSVSRYSVLCVYFLIWFLKNSYLVSTEWSNQKAPCIPAAIIFYVFALLYAWLEFTAVMYVTVYTIILFKQIEYKMWIRLRDQTWLYDIDKMQ